MNLVVTPLDRLAKQIERFYMNHTHLFEHLLRKIGAEEMDLKTTRVRCTCPIHGGQNKEGFAVYWDKGFPAWKCFSGSCGKGNLFTLLMKKYPGTSYQQAVVALGRLAGLQTDGLTIEVSKSTLEEEDLYGWKRRMGITTETVDTINVFPETMVQQSVDALYHPANQAHLLFLTEERKFPVEVLKKWQIGFVPARQWVWQDHEKPFKDDRKTPNLVGWFEDRISFPWRDNHGVLMGFAGRRRDGNPIRKYKMLPGTRRELALWGFHDPLCQEAIRATKTLVMMEGYTDIMRAHMHNCPHSTTLGGTALTDAQLRLVLSTGLERVVTYLDGDGAGRDAVELVGRQLMNYVRVDVATPPGEKDPDELYSYEEFWTPIVNARPFTSRSFS